ncbi:M14 family zinc carboxypeptidase [Aeromicrobium chenweiae]|uniref:Peptidase M14 domain-containing protein n=1 Tax=Aeromicrobium chenweiae TaxID=2079793 RepID=A0A2S0WPS2_9ACTN|nr:M14 family zinc carboxypeptidase [Aeromicrobium chenweiae]AWB93301.1 hypothetical protein C3E78_14390 [Aeromicrobium chenweiae]TGN34293.1 hypothetical protein E4L97_04420 [Aeromicrobium chenweiae]
MAPRHTVVEEEGPAHRGDARQRDGADADAAGPARRASDQRCGHLGRARPEPRRRAKGKRQNARGVDLNRNFSTGWRKKGGATYSGRKAFSEPETKAIRSFANKIKPRYTISFHQPLNGIDIRDTGNNKWAKRLAAEIRLPKKAFDCFSSCHGTYSMWVRKHHKKSGVITVEMPRKPSLTYLTRTAPRAVLRSINATR